MSYIVGYELRNQGHWVLPEQQCAFDLNVTQHKEYARQKMREETELAQTAGMLLRDNFSLHPPPGLEVPPEVVKHMREMLRDGAKANNEQTGNRIDRWSDFEQLKLVAYWGGEYYFFRDYAFFPTLAEALACRL